MNPSKIYVAVDFKSATQSVLSYAVWLAQTFECKDLCLFHIMEYTLTPPAYLISYINKEKKKIEEKLKALSEKLSHYELNIDFRVVFGRLIEGIKEVIKDKESYAVIGFKTHITRPSTSERILKGLNVPVLIVKGEEFNDINPAVIKVNKILCPVDFSSYSLSASNTAKKIAKKWNSELTVLHVVPEQKVRGILEEPAEIEKYIDYLKQEATEQIKRIIKIIHYEVVSGNPAEEILKKSKDVDLVVMGSKGRSYIEAVIIGSVAESVIKNSTKPILLIP